MERLDNANSSSFFPSRGPRSCSSKPLRTRNRGGMMPRYGYDDREYRGRPDARHSFGLRGYQMDAGWGWDDDGGDPNWRGGGYQGMRMEGGGRQAPYGRIPW